MTSILITVGVCSVIGYFWRRNIVRNNAENVRDIQKQAAKSREFAREKTEGLNASMTRMRNENKRLESNVSEGIKSYNSLLETFDKYKKDNPVKIPRKKAVTAKKPATTTKPATKKPAVKKTATSTRKGRNSRK